MSERHGRARAREVLTKAGYHMGGHFKADKSPAKRMIGEAIREHESHLHKGEAKTKLKFKEGGSVEHAAFGARIHKPRGMGMGKHKKPHTQINIAVGAGKQPVPVPVPVGGMGGPPPPVGPGAPQGPMPGQMGMKRGGRFCDGGSIKEKESQRNSVSSTSGKVEGKLKKGGKAKKLDFGGPVGIGRGFPALTPGIGGAPGSSIGGMGPNPGGVMQMTPNGGPSISGAGPNPGTINQVNPPPGGGNISGPGGGGPARPIPNLPRFGCGNMKRGGKAKTADPEMDAGAGGGLGRLEKARSYGAPVKKGGRAHHNV